MSTGRSVQAVRIVRGMRDDDGNHYVKLQHGKKTATLSVEELCSNDGFKKLGRRGIFFASNVSKERLRRAVEEFDNYEPCLALSRFGWNRGIYLYGNGHWAKAAGDDRRFIRPLEGAHTFGCAGTLEEWQQELSPFVVGQPLVLFTFAFGLIGPLLEFAPPDVQNPILEIVGPTHSGKSVLATVVGSLWGGDPDSPMGFGRTWEDTLAFILDSEVPGHRDSLLILDETNLIEPAAARSDVLRRALFALTANADRHRHGDARARQHARLAVLSTSNEPIYEILRSKAEGERAAISRALTCFADRAFGIFDTIPLGYGSAQAAVEEFYRVAHLYYGRAARRFVMHLASQFHREGEEFRSKVQQCYRGFLESHGKIVALACTAGHFGQAYGSLPATWGRVSDAAELLFQPTAAQTIQDQTPLSAIKAYVKREGAHFLDARCLTRRLTRVEFERAPGVWIDDEWFIISGAALDNRLGPSIEMLRALRAQGYLEGENGQQRKLTKKAPRNVCAAGSRAYFFKNPLRGTASH